MAEQTTVLNVSEMSATTVVVQPQVMIEKWLLVLLIVGCTSLVFLICFPIDFFLYRRRKRIARERKNIALPWYRPQTPTRAAQVHATLTLTQVAAEIDFEEMNAKDRKAYRAQRGIMRFLSKIRRKSNRQKFQETLTDSKSETGSDCRILTTPDSTRTLESTEYKNKNIFRDQNNSYTHIHDFNEVAGDAKHSMARAFESSNGHLDQACARKVSIASENEELVDREIKQLNYGAFQPLENMTSFTNETNEANCFTIPVRGRNLVLVKSENDPSKSYTDLKITNINGSQQDIIVESKSDAAKCVLTRGESDMDVTLINQNSVKAETETSAENIGLDKISARVEDIAGDEILSQEFNDVVEDLEIKRHGNLFHSNSDQCVSYNFKFSNIPFKSRIKGNVISPTFKSTSSASEHFCFDEKENCSLSGRRSSSLSTTLEEHSLTSNIKWKKKKTYVHTKPSESMPELKLYKKEKF